MPTKNNFLLLECTKFIDSVNLSSENIKHRVYDSEVEYFHHALLVLNGLTAEEIGVPKDIIEKFSCKTALEFYKSTLLDSFRKNAKILIERKTPESYAEFLEDCKKFLDVYIDKYLNGIFKCYDAVTKNKEIPFILDIGEIINLKL
jgi:hypothetical protein